jgi:hypothetical protein
MREIRDQPFSLNIDEATSKTNVRVLQSAVQEQIVIEHLEGIELVTA